MTLEEALKLLPAGREVAVGMLARATPWGKICVALLVGLFKLCLLLLLIMGSTKASERYLDKRLPRWLKTLMQVLGTMILVYIAFVMFDNLFTVCLSFAPLVYLVERWADRRDEPVPRWAKALRTFVYAIVAAFAILLIVAAVALALGGLPGF